MNKDFALKMRKKTIVVCLFLTFCFLLFMISCFRQPTQSMFNTGLILDLNKQQIQTSNNPLPYEPSDALVNVEVERTISFSQGLTYINDYFVVKNNKSNPKDFIQVGLPNALRGQLYYISAVGQDKERIRAQELAYDGSGFYKWNLYLDDPILPNEIFNFTLTMIFGDIINFNIFLGYGTNNMPIYGFYFYRYPSSPYYSESVTGVAVGAADSTPPIRQQTWLLGPI